MWQFWVIPTPSIPDVTILCQRISSAVSHIDVICYVQRSPFPGICQLVNERLNFSGVQFLIPIFICQIFSFSNINICCFPMLLLDFFIHFITSCSPVVLQRQAMGDEGVQNTGTRPPESSTRREHRDVQTTAKQDKSPAIATESIVLPVQSRQDRRKQLKAVVEDNQDNYRTTTIQVTLVRPGRQTVRWGHADSSQQHQHGIQRSLRWLTTATPSCSSSWPRCARRMYHQCHRLRAETIQAMCAQGYGAR